MPTPLRLVVASLLLLSRCRSPLPALSAGNPALPIGANQKCVVMELTGRVGVELPRGPRRMPEGAADVTRPGPPLASWHGQASLCPLRSPGRPQVPQRDLL